jgi:molybdopterin molybdotransferase
MRTVEEHQAAVRALARPLETVTCALADALGCAVATDVAAPFALPPFDNSAMDGYAVRAADAAAAPVTLAVTSDIPAGRGDVVALKPGEAHRIMTGAPLPPGADAVVPVESTDGGMPTVRVDQAPTPGQHIRRAGEDVAPGTVVLRAGDELTPARIGLLAALGRPTATVRRRPRVAVLPTGSELVEPGSPLPAGQIYNSNGPLLAAQVREVGAVPTVLRAVDDGGPAFGAELSAAAEWADLILTTGGISAGAYEVVKDRAGEHGHVEFVTVAMQPGRPQGLGTVGERAVPIITLPGNPVSVFVSFEVFVRPVLRLMLGCTRLDRPTRLARLAAPVASVPGKRQYRRAWCDQAEGEVRLVGGSGSHLIGALAGANCLAVFAEDVERVDVGAEIPVILID